MKNFLSILFFALLMFTFSMSISAQTPCSGGSAAGFPCSNVDLAAYMPLSAMGGPLEVQDIWGWTHAGSGREFAIICQYNGTGFIEVTNPNNPVYLGRLPGQTSNSQWHDIKTYNNHAYIVSEATGYGVQVFNLTQLLSVGSPPMTFSNTAHYNGIGSAHNIVINESTGFAYAVGSAGGTQSGCSGGLHMIDISNPTNPTFAGCYSLDGYTHDAQCVTYNGPDAAYVGREICFCYNTDTQTIVDVTNKSNPIELSRTSYPGTGYTHQGWLTEDQRYTLLNDEYDELNTNNRTRTYVMDNQDLDLPDYRGYHQSTIRAIDHNLYIKGNFAYEANYRGGLRILELTDLPNANLTEVGYFDVYPGSDSNSFNGAWSVYPYFPSGTIIVSGIEQGLFVLDASAATTVACTTNNVAVNLTTDNNAGQTSWNITDVSNSSVVASNGSLSNSTTTTDNLCLTAGCYKFTILDSAGNGLSGSGSYTLSINGTQIRVGSNYGSGESIEFCINPANQSYCPVNLSDSGTITNSYQVSSTITSDGMVPNAANVDYRANCIQLLPPFEASKSANFKAVINPCN